MDRYIGLDVHAPSTTLAVVGPSGKRLKVEVVETNAQCLIEAVRRVGGHKQLCLEEGTQSEWLCEVLQPYVDELVVLAPRDKRKEPKNDAADAWGLAEKLQSGQIEARVFKPVGKLTGLREAVRGYGMLTRDLARNKNRLRAIFRSRGLAEAKSELYRATSRSHWIEQLPEERRPLAELLGEVIDQQTKLHERAEARLSEQARDLVEVARIETAPGIGLIRAAQIVAVVVTPHRFRTKRQFWQYCGLGIVTHSSSDWVRMDKKWVRKNVQQTRGLNRNRQPMLKAVFKGAAHTVITQMPDHPLHHAYQRMLDAGTKPNLAKVTLARRIAAAVLAMWKNKEAYNPEKHERNITR